MCHIAVENYRFVALDRCVVVRLLRSVSVVNNVNNKININNNAKLKNIEHK